MLVNTLLSENYAQSDGAAMLYRNLFELNPVAMVLTLNNFEISTINDAFFKIFPLKAKTYSTTICQLLDIDNDTFRKILKSEKNILERQFEGRNYVYKVTGSSINLSNQDYYLFSFTDITKSIEDEERNRVAMSRLENLIRNYSAGILLEDENRRIVVVNEKFLTLFGIPVPPEALIGADCSQSAQQSKHLFINPEEFVTGIDVLLANQEPVYNQLFEMVIGTVLERDYIPLFVGEKYIGHLWQYRDITEKILRENELISAREEAQLAAAAKQRFLSTMSHEIRTPLNVILGMSQLLQHIEMGKKGNEYVSAILKSGEYLLTLLNDMLDYSRMEAGKLTVHHSVFELKPLLSDIFEGVRLSNSDKPIEFINKSSIELAASYIKTDKTRLSQILLNLLNNASKFTEQGIIELDAKIADNWLQISVTDSGKGIEEDKIEKIFETFTQENEAIAQNYGGSGLGLSIVKNLVALLNGKLNVKTKLGVGSTFSVGLPIEIIEGYIENKSKQLTENDFNSISNLKILLAEDHELNRLMAVSFLSNYGIIPDEALNGQEAVLLAKQNRYDVILMDIQMPILNGKQAMLEIRNGYGPNRNSWIIAMTANAFPEDRAELIGLGFSDFTPKPFSQKKFLDQLAEVASKLPPKPKKIIYSPAELLNKLNGNFKALINIESIFVESTLNLLREIESAFNEKNPLKISEVCHKLKSGYRMMGLDDLGNIAEEIEILASKNTLPNSEMISLMVTESGFAIEAVKSNISKAV